MSSSTFGTSMPQNTLLQAVTSRFTALQAHAVRTQSTGERSVRVFPAERFLVVEITRPVWLRNRESAKNVSQKAPDD
jgi:hypothetical protein